MKTKLMYSVLILATVFLMSSCTAEVTPINECIQREPFGFWYGVWHGMIMPITLIISFFSDTVTIYEISNNGGWYNTGFVIGTSLLSGGGATASSKRN